MEVQLIYNVMLISGGQNSDSITHSHAYIQILLLQMSWQVGNVSPLLLLLSC